MKHCSNIAMLTALVMISGCATAGSRNKQLEQIAKDWAMTIRASQVIPVYPLNEDVQPGDIFLVQTPIEEQAKIYKTKGFLSLDQLVKRLQPANYKEFYLGAYGIAGHEGTPHHWQFPADGTGVTEWAKAPRVAFPSYSFSVKRGGGLNLAVPVQGIPMALNMMRTTQASGNITIADAYTYGTDIQPLKRQVDAWASENKEFLKAYAPTKDSKGKETNTFYLRVVNRVYLTGSVNVSVSNDESSGAATAAGAEKVVATPIALSSNAATNATETADTLDAKPQSAALPGGALKIASASSRSVNMVETFPRPLVIGYLGFDIPIKDNGELGSPEPTQSRLDGAILPQPATTYETDDNSDKIQVWIDADPQNKTLLKAWLKEQGHEKVGLTNIITGKEYAGLRKDITSNFKLP